VASLHVAQINFIPPPASWEPDEVFLHWPSLPDVAAAVCRSGTRVTVIQLASRAARVERDGVDYRFESIEGAPRPADRGRLVARMLESLDVDVIHVNGLGFAEETFALAGRMPGVPIVLQDHANRLPRWWQRPLWRRWYRVASGVAFTAIEQARPFVDAGLFDASLPMFAIPESSSHFEPGSRARARFEMGLHGDPCVLWVGHLNGNKDPLTMLEGVAQAVSRLPGLQLWCAFGSAPLMDEVRQRIDGDARLAGRVHLLGRVEHARVETLMRAADIYLSASHVEGSGYALLEPWRAAPRRWSPIFRRSAHSRQTARWAAFGLGATPLRWRLRWRAHRSCRYRANGCAPILMRPCRSRWWGGIGPARMRN